MNIQQYTAANNSLIDSFPLWPFEPGMMVVNIMNWIVINKLNSLTLQTMNGQVHNVLPLVWSSGYFIVLNAEFLQVFLQVISPSCMWSTFESLSFWLISKCNQYLFSEVGWFASCPAWLGIMQLFTGHVTLNLSRWSWSLCCYVSML